MNTIPFWSDLGFQNLVGLTYRELESLHDIVIVWLVVIISLVILIRYKVLFRIRAFLTQDSEVLEKTWTLIPIAILIRIAIPRLHLLCAQDSMCYHPVSRLKVISNQWNWQREVEEPYDHLLDTEELDNLGSYEIPVLLIAHGVSRVLLTRTDVLHSLGLPRLGLKLDSTPGRLNTTTVEAFVPGLYVGSCFELCGRGHRAIPINMIAM